MYCRVQQNGWTKWRDETACRTEKKEAGNWPKVTSSTNRSLIYDQIRAQYHVEFIFDLASMAEAFSAQTVETIDWAKKGKQR